MTDQGEQRGDGSQSRCLDDQSGSCGARTRTATDPEIAGSPWILGTCIYLIILPLLLGYCTLKLWPPDDLPAIATTNATTAPSASPASVPVAFFPSICGGFSLPLTFPVRLLLLVMVMGAFGSYIHIAISFVDYVGNRQLCRSWIPWYYIRPLVGMALALVFYCIVRGGFLSPNAAPEGVNVYGIAGLAALVGMFSKQATDKLSELLKTLFKTDEDARKDKLAAKPVITRTDPPGLVVNTAATLKITGENFIRNSVVQIDSVAFATTFVSATSILAEITATSFPKPGTKSLVVLNPAATPSEPFPIEVRASA